MPVESGADNNTGEGEQAYAGYYPMYRHEYSYSPPHGSSGFVSGSPAAPLSPVTGFAVMGGSPAQYYYAMGGSPGSPQMPPLVGSPQLATLGGAGLGSSGPFGGPGPFGPFAGLGIGAPQPFVPRDEPRSDPSAVDSRNVYIRNLNEDCTDSTLAQMASPFGDIESSKSIIHDSTGKCKGYGFVKYRTEEQASRAIEAFNAQGFQSTLARDSFKAKLKRLQDRTSANVYVSNLPSSVDEEQLTALARPHAVLSARILRDPVSGQHKGAGFIRMADRDTALAVIEQLKGVRLANAPGPLIPRIADSQGQKLLKKHANADSTREEFRSATTSPLMWSPVLVYSPATSPPPHDARRIPSPSFAHDMFVPYAGYASPPYAAGYASPQPMYAHLPEQPQVPQPASMQNVYAANMYAQHMSKQPMYGSDHPAYGSDQPAYGSDHQQQQQLRRPPDARAVGDLATTMQDKLAM
ncbi:hypothetical protein IW145_002465 [Coemansia sp. RSA 521]|nr:hypothetical protein IW144_002313 [Coemansia sp. RSA 522]KAJ2205936.1 hypothetical protein IW145_002465 [Coemansia sp. RSA 521]KAJ2275446.1 hypothetical protein J3F81_001806 [Coemansia sp. RSA 371]KAJ2289308.1 hypothetical protein IW141_003905 [Coemansia sp. RSA 355]